MGTNLDEPRTTPCAAFTADAALFCIASRIDGLPWPRGRIKARCISVCSL